MGLRSFLRRLRTKKCRFCGKPMPCKACNDVFLFARRNPHVMEKIMKEARG